MRWKPKDREQWHTWFAWYPVMISETEAAWFEKVLRRQEYFWAGVSSYYKPID